MIPSTEKAFDVEFCQTSKWKGDRLVRIAALWHYELQAKQPGLVWPAKNPAGHTNYVPDPADRSVTRTTP